MICDNEGMSWTRDDAERETFYDRMYSEFGQQWVSDHAEDLYRQHYDEAVKEFTAERLKSYYVAHPALAEPAHGILHDAQSLMESNRRASLVFAVIAIELAIKTLLLKPIVFGLVHIEVLASLITELTIQHTGMERFEDLLAKILAQFGGVDLKSFKRAGSAKTLMTEVKEVQKLRNAVIHRGEKITESATTTLAVAAASALLNNIFPEVLANLGLHLHAPGIVCSKLHVVSAHAYFYPFPEHVAISGSVELDLDNLDLNNTPDTITGTLGADFSHQDVAALRSPACALTMCIASTLYGVTLASDENTFTGLKVKP
jgi:hypothetical protein